MMITMVMVMVMMLLFEICQRLHIQHHHNHHHIIISSYHHHHIIICDLIVDECGEEVAEAAVNLSLCGLHRDPLAQ